MRAFKNKEAQTNFGPFTSDFLNQDFSSFQAANYLRFYQGLSFLLASQSNSLAKKTMHSYLQRSVSLFDSIKYETQKQSFDLEYWRRVAIEELIKYHYSEKAYFKVIKYTQMLADRPLSQYHLKLVAMSYFETNQLTRFQRIMLKFPKLLNEIKLPSTIKNQQLILKIKSQVSNNRSDKRSKKNIDKKSYNLSEYKKLLIKIERSYFGEYLLEYKGFLNRYAEGVHSRLKKDKEFVKFFEKSLAKLPPNLVLTYIRKMWHRQHLAKAVMASDLFLESFKGHQDYSIVAYDRGRILEDQGNHKQAYQSFKKLKKWITGTSHEENFDFRIAWLAYLSRDGSSSKLFEEYLKKYPKGEYYSACFYFLIEVLKQQKSAAKVAIKNRVTNFISRDPMNYYSLRLLKDWGLPKKLVLDQLGGRARTISKHQDSPHQVFGLGVREQHLWDLYLELREFGLHEDAYLVLAELSERLSKSPEWFAYSIGQAKKFDHPSFVTIKAPQVFYRFTDLKEFLSWKDIYPPLYKEQITENIAKLNSPLSYQFIVSLIRQESAFNPSAISSANANGLMQIIPSTAKTLARKLNLSEYDVFEPSINIKLGISLLNRLYHKYDGRLDYMLSAYNAGDGVTDRWIRRRGSLSQIQFIESIPYKETRNYIKLIFRNMEFYNMIYDEAYSKTG